MADAPLCPSATLDSADAQLRISGVVGGDGRITNLRTPLPVDAAMRAELARHGPAERRFRFSARCAEQACHNWRTSEGGGQCGLIGRIRAHVAETGAMPAEAPGLQPCAIRARCRWWQQDAAAACAVCSLVTYNAADA